jgi:hypothetical protein
MLIYCQFRYLRLLSLIFHHLFSIFVSRQVTLILLEHRLDNESCAEGIIQIRLPTGLTVSGGFSRTDSGCSVLSFACCFFRPDKYSSVVLRQTHSAATGESRRLHFKRLFSNLYYLYLASQSQYFSLYSSLSDDYWYPYTTAIAAGAGHVTSHCYRFQTCFLSWITS